MTVKELISELQKIEDQDLPVTYVDEDFSVIIRKVTVYPCGMVDLYGDDIFNPKDECILE